MKPWYKINKLIISLLVGLSFVFSQNNITVEGDIVADETWTANNTYFLNTIYQNSLTYFIKIFKITLHGYVI